MEDPPSQQQQMPITNVFDVDQRTGFMAPDPPLSRLPQAWELWEAALDSARDAKLQLGDKVGITAQEVDDARIWRGNIRETSILPTDKLANSAILLRRAHLVLAFLLHFFIQSLPSTQEVFIPPSIGIPLLEVSKQLDIPPLLTFSDTVLFNWKFKIIPKTEDAIPELENISTQTMFTSLIDEEEFYLCSARIELRGIEVLELMRQTMDEAFVGDAIAFRRINEYLHSIAQVIDDLKSLLLDVKTRCDPDIYYNKVRPWFRGEDSAENPRKWVFEGIEEHPELRVPAELSGPSAGQSSMIHVLDIFLGVDHGPTSPGQPPFMSRMQSYMPRNHRRFLEHLKVNPRPLRAFVQNADDPELRSAYNHAVISLKQFRDAHMIIAALYILGPARRVRKNDSKALDNRPKVTEKGTGGTELVKFLKDTRTRTNESLLSEI